MGGALENYYDKKKILDRDSSLEHPSSPEESGTALVYKADALKWNETLHGMEPRSRFLLTQDSFHIACMRIVYQENFMGEIYLHRSKDKPDFDEEDLFVLGLLQPHVSTIFHIIHTMTAAKFMETENGKVHGKGLCLLDENLTIAGVNVAALDLLRMSTVFGSSVLYHVKEFCEDLLSEKPGTASISQHDTAIQTKQGVLLVHLMFQRAAKERKGKFFVTMEFEEQQQAASEYKLKFTKREADIIDGVIQGKNNAQLAAVLNLSENTIKTHIKSIYRKVGAKNRTELAYILMMGSS